LKTAWGPLLSILRTDSVLTGDIFNTKNKRMKYETSWSSQLFKCLCDSEVFLRGLINNSGYRHCWPASPLERS